MVANIYCQTNEFSSGVAFRSYLKELNDFILALLWYTHSDDIRLSLLVPHNQSFRLPRPTGSHECLLGIEIGRSMSAIRHASQSWFYPLDEVGMHHAAQGHASAQSRLGSINDTGVGVKVTLLDQCESIISSIRVFKVRVIFFQLFHPSQLAYHPLIASANLENAFRQ